MKILFFGDVVGRAGRLAVREHAPVLVREFGADVVIANGENIAGGIGMTSETLDELFDAGVDLVTSGNHVWRHREIMARLGRDRRLVRPANFPEGAPGRGWLVHSLPDGRRLALANILGTTFMEALPCPFRCAGEWLDALDAMKEPPAVRIVDFHAEATSEKKTMGFFLDGRVSALFGTHTHVQTSDARILPKGSGYLTDLGMCGVEDSSLGMEYEGVLERYLTRRPGAVKPARGSLSVNGAFLEVDDDSGRATKIQAVRAGAWA